MLPIFFNNEWSNVLAAGEALDFVALPHPQRTTRTGSITQATMRVLSFIDHRNCSVRSFNPVGRLIANSFGRFVRRSGDLLTSLTNERVFRPISVELVVDPL